MSQSASKTIPAAQPSGSNPQLLVTRYESYSPLDQPTRVVDSPGGASSPTRTTTITYDAAGRQLRTEQTGGGTAPLPIETLYDPDNGLPEVQQFVCEAPQNCSGFDSQSVTTVYDPLGRVAYYEDADGNLSQTEYDLLGRPIVTTDGKGTQTMTYDATSGALVQMTDSAAGTFTAAYDADGNVVAQGLPNGLLAQTTYDEAGAPVHLRYDKVTGCSVDCTWLVALLEGGQPFAPTSRNLRRRLTPPCGREAEIGLVRGRRRLWTRPSRQRPQPGEGRDQGFGPGPGARQAQGRAPGRAHTFPATCRRRWRSSRAAMSVPSWSVMKAVWRLCLHLPGVLLGRCE